MSLRAGCLPSSHQPSERDQIAFLGPRFELALAGIERRNPRLAVQIEEREKMICFPSESCWSATHSFVPGNEGGGTFWISHNV